MISMLDLGWVAGFLEGEGTFNFNNIAIVACQVEIEPLEKLHNLFGGTVDRQKIKGSCSLGYINQWRLHGSSAIGLMMTIYPLMSPKRCKQIEKVIQTWKDRPGRKYRVLTDDQVRQARRSTLSSAELGRLWGVSASVVSRARSFEVRRDVV